jgi:hypothetical protein
MRGAKLAEFTRLLAQMVQDDPEAAEAYLVCLRRVAVGLQRRALNGAKHFP